MKPLFDQTQLPLTPATSSVAGVRTAYWMAGAPTGEPLILLHGFGGSHHGLLPLGQRLSDYRLFIPDLPGHGDSAIPEAATVAILAEWFEAFVRMIREQTNQPPIIVAHSFGSQVAFNTCQKLADDYAVCVLLTPVPRVSPIPYIFGKTMNLVPSNIAVGVVRNEHMRHMRGSYLQVRHTPEVEQLVRWVGDQSANTPDKTVFNIEISRQVLDVLAYDPELVHNGRFYCISGDTDRMVDAANMDFLKKTFGEDHFFVCQNTGHLMPIEAPDDTAALVRPLLPKA